MIIDSHAHIVPSNLIKEIKKTVHLFPSLELISSKENFGFSFCKTKSTRPVSNKLTDVEKRLKWMDQQKIDIQIVGGWVDMFGYQLPNEEGTKWCELINHHLKSFSEESKGRFLSLACLPMQ